MTLKMISRANGATLITKIRGLPDQISKNLNKDKFL